MKINKYEFSHLTNMDAMPVYGKIIKKKRLLWNQWTDCLETWYIVLGSQGPIVFYSTDDWLDRDPIYIKVKLGCICFLHWEKWKLLSFGNYCCL